jgi:hypothetical protein
VSKANQSSKGSGRSSACGTVIHGELPSAITKEGLTWPDEASHVATQAIAKLQAQLSILEEDVKEIAEHVVLKNPLP